MTRKRILISMIKSPSLGNLSTKTTRSFVERMFNSQMKILNPKPLPMRMTTNYSQNKKRKNNRLKRKHSTTSKNLLWSNKKIKSIRREIRLLNRYLAR